MDRNVLASLSDNAALLLALSIIYEVGYLIPRRLHGLRQVINGLLIAVICIMIMAMPFQITPGLIFDTRSILISVAALTFGWIPALITSAAAAIFRLYTGGVGTLPGLAVIASSAIIGLAWRQWLYPKSRRWRLVNIYFMGLVVHGTMLCCMLLLPYPDNSAVIRTIALPVIIVYPLASILLSLLLLHQQERNEALIEKSEANARYRSLFNNNHTVMLLIDPENGRLLDANPAAAAYYGWTQDEMRHKKIDDISTLSLDEIRQEMSILTTGVRNDFLFRQRCADGSERDVEAYCGPIIMNGRRLLCMIVHDVTNRMRMEEALRQSEDKYRKIADNISDVVWTVDLSLKTTYVSPSVKVLLGESADDHMKRTLDEKFPPDSLKMIHILFSKELEKEKDPSSEKDRAQLIEAEHYRADGTIIWIAMHITFLRDENGKAIGFLGVSRDITEQKMREAQIRYMNDHDFLTGLYNRKYFEEAKTLIDTQECLPVTIIIADINGVRLINDAFGHTEGDRIIVETAKLLQSCCREGDTLARTGGDEFSFLLPNTGREEANKMLLMIKEACEAYNSSIKDKAELINLSLGFGVRQTNENCIDETEKEAEAYLYKRKLLEQKSHHNAILSSVMATMYARSHETEEHARRLAVLSRIIGEKIRLPQKSLDDLQLLSMLHDIGKVGIDDRILNKPGKLTTGEWAVMKKHTEIGYRIAMSTPEFESIAEYILSHHERWDGLGYPRGLYGEEIPLLSRILAVVDSYDAMTEDRVYRKALSKNAAIGEIEKNAGTQYDPQIVKIFIENIY